MANFVGITASSGVKVKPDKVAELDQYLEKFHLAMEDGNWGVENDDNGEPCFVVWGYDGFDVRHHTDEVDEFGYPIYDDEDCIEEFLNGLVPFILDGDTLTVQTIGYEKCRFPLMMAEWKVTQKGVERTV